MRIIQIVPRIADESSGPSHSVPGLSRALAEAGDEVDLFVLEPLPEKKIYERTTAFPCWPGKAFHKLGYSPRMKNALCRAAKTSEVLHTNSLWMMPNIYPANAVRGTQCKFVVSPRGTVSDWALSRSRWIKQIVGWWGQNEALRRADCIHVTSEDELEQVRRLDLRNPVAVVPNGIECPSEVPARNEGDLRQLLFLGRIHPTKCLELLVDAWVRLENEFADWELVIVGPTDNDYARKLQATATERGLQRIRFVGERKGADKAASFADSELFVLPSRSENFGMAVAEALAHGTPAAVSQGAPWAGLEKEDCGWWFRLTADDLLAALREAMKQSREELAAKGQRGREWMQREYSWSAIAERMRPVYQWLCGRGDRPEYVQLANG